MQTHITVENLLGSLHCINICIRQLLSCNLNYTGNISDSSYSMHMYSVVIVHDSRARDNSPLIEKASLKDRQAHKPWSDSKAESSSGVFCITLDSYPVITSLKQ